MLTLPEKEKQPAGCGNVAPNLIAYYYPYSILFLDKLFLLVESIQSEAIDLMERSCRNTNSIAFSHLSLRGWTFKVRNVSTGCENKRDNPIKWQRHVLFASTYCTYSANSGNVSSLKLPRMLFCPILLRLKFIEWRYVRRGEVVSKWIKQPR